MKKKYGALEVNLHSKINYEKVETLQTHFVRSYKTFSPWTLLLYVSKDILEIEVL